MKFPFGPFEKHIHSQDPQLLDTDCISSSRLHQEGDLATLDPEERKFSDLGRVTGKMKEVVVHMDG